MTDLVVVACAISAGIHAALVPTHGAAFAGAALVLAVLAAAVTRNPSRLTLLAAATTFAGLLGSWLLAVTTGLPLVHPRPEPVAGLALFTKGVEAVGLLATVTPLRSKGPLT